MADVQPLRALRYEPDAVGGLSAVTAPPYDVIDAERRAALAARSSYNVVHVDLPEGDDPYATAAALVHRWREEGALVRDAQPALWALAQEYGGPDGARQVRRGLFARVRVEEYGAGRIRPHERTHPGPKEDRLRLTRATHVNLSPIFSLYSDAAGAVSGALGSATGRATVTGESTDDEGTVHRVERLEDPEAIVAVQEALAGEELLIADGHHRYETARVYAEEIGGEGPHRYVLMCLVALEDPGLDVLPTHRLVRGLSAAQRENLAAAIRRDFEVAEISPEELDPPPGDGPLVLGYMDAHSGQPLRLTLRDGVADAALRGHSDAYRRLDTALLEALLLEGALGMDEEDISHLRGLGYARDTDEARGLLAAGEYDAAFFMRGTPIEAVRAVAASGETMPPKSTFFHPKIPTGLLFNPLDDE